MKKIVNCTDYISVAKEKLSQDAWNYIDGAAEDEISKNDNSAAYGRIKLIPRVLNDIKARKYSTKILGQEISLPVLLGPTSPLRLAHEDAEFAQVRAAVNSKTIAVCSMDAHYSLEETAALANNNLWFQLYCYGNRELMEQIVRRAELAGYLALVVTVDANYPGRRERMLRSNFVMPSDIKMGNLEALNIDPELQRADGSIKRFALTWSDLEWLRTITKMPIVLKGILSSSDAAKAADHGINAIIVSNHGGRQLDHVPATIDILPGIVKHTKGKIDILIDGGIYRGTDVLKALALGATATLIGRAYIWGLAANGQQGIEHVIEMLRQEIDSAMNQLGISDIADMNEDMVIAGSVAGGLA
jgi:4-hydroxymandelate oxidase